MCQATLECCPPDYEGLPLLGIITVGIQYSCGYAGNHVCIYSTFTGLLVSSGSGDACPEVSKCDFSTPTPTPTPAPTPTPTPTPTQTPTPTSTPSCYQDPLNCVNNQDCTCSNLCIDGICQATIECCPSDYEQLPLTGYVPQGQTYLCTYQGGSEQAQCSYFTTSGTLNVDDSYPECSNLSTCYYGPPTLVLHILKSFVKRILNVLFE